MRKEAIIYDLYELLSYWRTEDYHEGEL